MKIVLDNIQDLIAFIKYKLGMTEHPVYTSKSQSSNKENKSIV